MNKYQKLGVYVLKQKHRLPKEFNENILRITKAMGMLKSENELNVMVAELEISYYARDIFFYLKEENYEKV